MVIRERETARDRSRGKRIGWVVVVFVVVVVVVVVVRDADSIADVSKT